MNPLSSENLDRTLGLLAEYLTQANAPPEHFVVIGGSALIALGFVSRTTTDVDILAAVDARGLVDARPLSEPLQRAADQVARALGLVPRWLNTGPADQLQAGLPDGFRDRLIRRDYGPHLTIWLADRYDLIHLKLFALVDQGRGRHSQDLAAQRPTDGELLAAARWVLTQNASADFPQLVRSALESLGYGHLAPQI